MFHVQRFLALPKFVGSVFHFWVHVSCLGCYLNRHMKRKESEEDIHCSCWRYLHHVHVIALQANICSLTEFYPADLVFHLRPPNCGAIGHHGSDHYGVSMLILFQNKFNVFDIGSQLQ